MRKVLYILTQLSDEDVDWIASAGRRKRLEPGEVLIHEGEPVDALSFVLDGSFSVSVAGVGEVARLASGEILGEMSLVDEHPPIASVTTVERAHVLSVDRDRLNAKIDSDPHFAARLYRAIAMFLSIRMRSTVQQLGYGADRPSSQEEIAASQEEIDMELLDKVHLAGARFDRMLKKLMVGA